MIEVTLVPADGKPIPVEPRRTMVFVGSCLLKNKKLGQMWHDAEPEGVSGWKLDPGERVYDGLVRYASVGAMYTFKVFPDAGKIGVPGVYFGMWPDADQRLKWEMAERAFKAGYDITRREKGDRSNTAIREACGPLRKAYQRMPAPQRAQMLAAIVYEITRKGDGA